MDKIWIILQSEFLRRVRTRTFVLTTLLAPVLLLAMALLPALIGYLGSRDTTRHLAVIDSSGVLLSRMQALAPSTLRLEAVSLPLDSLQAAVRQGRYDGYLILPASLIEGEADVEFYVEKSPGLSFQGHLERLINQAVREVRIERLQVPPELVAVLRSEVSLRQYRLSETGAEEDGTVFFSIIGYLMGFIIYGATLGYGSLVMQGVIEEKSSRVVELIVSSVRPFHLLMGKVLGIGAMGLVQFMLWGILLIAGAAAAGPIIAYFLDPQQLNLPTNASTEELLAAANITLPTIDPVLIVWFVLFFLGGYLLYSSLFAAAGSAVEQQQDAQSLMLPLMLLIMLPIFFITYVIESPSAPLSVGLSLFPFFSPILMMVRIAIGSAALWEAVLAYLLLVAGFLGAIWVSARIYRIGILSYGQKPSLRELLRWLRA
ncbi:ABC transporter permease [Rhodothermus profundi]|uniref:ABC-2 type transport system permease protein n=1 Tax=Rhodothermus profundi TaxID=633813 RepID=A0A1M6RWQ5_9BACT|nr:ABC transporter permease [Rhodothermus profundi]SHK36932.1 ABC-2 type transport system permease protein [Rhodothermus profundi]